MEMKDTDWRMREAVVEFATSLYGGSWRERLAEISGVPKRELADCLDNFRPLPRKVSLSALRSMEIDLEARLAELDKTRNRVKDLRQVLIAESVRVDRSGVAEEVSEVFPPQKARPSATRRAGASAKLRLIASEG